MLFENRILRKIRGPKRGKVTMEWRKLHNEELNILYLSKNIVWVIKFREKLGGACSTYGEEERRREDCGGKTCRIKTTCETQA
jgi:hypothetical protein